MGYHPPAWTGSEEGPGRYGRAFENSPKTTLSSLAIPAFNEYDTSTTKFPSDGLVNGLYESFPASVDGPPVASPWHRHYLLLAA